MASKSELPCFLLKNGSIERIPVDPGTAHYYDPPTLTEIRPGARTPQLDESAAYHRHTLRDGPQTVAFVYAQHQLSADERADVLKAVANHF
jgi:hypothetical protein